MALINLRWQSIKVPAEIGGWIAFRKHLDDEAFLNEVCDERTIYVVRLCRPFSMHYPNNVSCAMYIGRGDFKKRITSHLKSWIKPLCKHITDLEVEILVCLPRVQKNFTAYKDAEASLIDLFEERFGSLPIKNKRRERSARKHTFSKGDLAKAFGLGQGTGYHWAIWPVGSNPLRRK
jgi:hypothetical protein